MRELAMRDFSAKICCEKCGRPFSQQAEKDGIVLTGTVLWHAGKSLPLPPREAEIVHEFLRVYPDTILRERLFVKVWGSNSEVEDKILDVYLVKIRKKLPSIGLKLATTYAIGIKLAKQ